MTIPKPRLSYAHFAEGQQLFRVSAYSRLVGQHVSTSYRQIARGELPVLLTADGPRIARETIVQRMGERVEPWQLPKKGWLRRFTKKQSADEPPDTR